MKLSLDLRIKSKVINIDNNDCGSNKHGMIHVNHKQSKAEKFY